MSNYDCEIEELTKDIQKLEITRLDKERKLKELLKKKENFKEEKRDYDIKDRHGNAIFIGDRVKVVTKGRFNSTEGKVIKIKKWVTFLDTSGVKQVRAPANLIVTENVAKRHTHGSNP